MTINISNGKQWKHEPNSQEYVWCNFSKKMEVISAGVRKNASAKVACPRENIRS